MAIKPHKLSEDDLIIGIDIGGTNIKGSLIKGNEVLRSYSVPTLAHSRKNILLERIFSVIDVFFSREIKGIGVGFPAPIIDGIAYEVNNIPCFNGVNIKKVIEKRYKVRCEVENDANCFTLSQAVFGAGKKENVVVGVTLGTGIGIGVVIDKKVFSGKRGVVGELNMLPFKDSKLENYTSAKFFINNVGKHPIEVAEAAKAGRLNAKKLYENYGKNLGVAFALIINAYDPDMIVLGGKIANSFHLFKKGLLDEMRKYLYKKSSDSIKIIATDLEHSSERGAALLLFQ